MKNDNFINAFNNIELDSISNDKILKHLHQEVTIKNAKLDKKLEILLCIFFVIMQISKFLILSFIFYINFIIGILVILALFYIECILSILFYLLNRKSYIKRRVKI